MFIAFYFDNGNIVKFTIPANIFFIAIHIMMFRVHRFSRLSYVGNETNYSDLNRVDLFIQANQSFGSFTGFMATVG